MSTIFSRIIAGEIPAQKVYEDDRLIAILDINPIQKGHTLLIPKKPYRWLEECDDELIAHLFLTAKELMINMKQTLGCEYVHLNVEGVDVPHVHVHLIPSTTAEKNGQWNHVSYAEGEMEAYQKKLAMNI